MCISGLTSISNSIVGLAVAIIALQQWQVARNKLRLDLFDRRYKVFEATRLFLSVILSEATFSDAQLLEFYRGTSDTAFLFDQQFVDYLKEIAHRALDMRTHQTIWRTKQQGDERTRLIEAEHEQLQWLGDQIGAMTKVFVPYLGFSKIK